MVLFASFNGPSDARCWFAFVASATFAIVVGFVVRSASTGFLVGGAAAAAIALMVLGTASGDMVFLMTAVLSPIFGLVGGLCGCCAGLVSARTGTAEKVGAASGVLLGGFLAYREAVGSRLWPPLTVVLPACGALLGAVAGTLLAMCLSRFLRRAAGPVDQRSHD